MKRCFLSAALLLVAAAAVAQPPAPPAVTVVPRPPAPKWTELRVPRGQVTLSAGERPARWVLIDADGADLTTPADPSTNATFSSSRDGRFRLVAFVEGSPPLLVTVVVGDGDPPGPKPPNPPPADPLREKIRSAFDADGAQLDKRRADARTLAELYRQAAKLAADDTVPTSGELLRRIREAAGTLLGPDSLVGVRKVVAAELLAVFPADGPLTPESRTQAAATFAKLAVILDSL